MSFEFMWGVTAFTFGMAFTPGANCAIAFSTGLNYGFLSVLPFMFGVCVGIPLITLAVAWGMGEFFAAFPEAYVYLRYAGVGYIFYLAWKIATAPVGEKDDGEKKGGPARRFTFLNGVLFQWVNPKVWLLAVTSIAAYVGKDLDHAKLLFLCVIFSVMCFFSLIAWTLGGMLSGRLVRSSRALRAMNLFMGFLLAGSVLTLF